MLNARRVECFERFRSGLDKWQGLPNFGAGIWPLYRDECEIRARRDDQAKITDCVLLVQPFDVFVGSARIDHQTEKIFSEKIHNQVVNHTTIWAQHARVQGFARHLQFINVVRQNITQKIAGFVTRNIDHTHVRDIKNPCVAAHGVVFFDLRTIVHRHIPAAKIDHARTCANVGGMKWGVF